MWHQSGSTGLGITWQKAEEWIEKLNKSRYAGFRNWRLPTLEEAASLLKPGKEGSVLYIDPIFDSTQKYIWTGGLLTLAKAILHGAVSIFTALTET